jgi:transposase-like protein
MGREGREGFIIKKYIHILNFKEQHYCCCSLKSVIMLPRFANRQIVHPFVLGGGLRHGNKRDARGSLHRSPGPARERPRHGYKWRRSSSGPEIQKHFLYIELYAYIRSDQMSLPSC